MSDLRDPEAIRKDIESSRQELGESVEALAAKVNVKARARSKLDDSRRTLAAAWQTALEHKVLLIGTGVLATVALLALVRPRDA